MFYDDDILLTSTEGGRVSVRNLISETEFAEHRDNIVTVLFAMVKRQTGLIARYVTKKILFECASIESLLA